MIQEKRMEKTKFGVLGASAHFLNRIAPALAGSEGAVFAALASRDPERAKRAADEWNIPRVCGYEELLALPEIDAVYIPLPNHLHAEWIVRAARAGKHVLCEKPLALDAKEADRAVAAAEDAHVFLLEGFMYKFHPQWRHIRELVSRGEIGAVTAIHTRFTYNNTDPKNIRNRLETGGGGLLDIGCYAASVPRYLLGREPERVCGDFYRAEDTAVDTLCQGLFDFGAVQAGFFTGTASAPFQRVTVQGTRGLIEAAAPFNPDPEHPAEVTVVSGGAKRLDRLPPANHYRIMFEKFAEAVRGWAPLPVAPEDTVRNMKVLDAVRHSHETGKWVRL